MNNVSMKKTTLALTLSTVITLSSNAQALELLVVSNYDNAGSEEIWKKAKTDQVPEVLLGNESVSAPGSAYSSLFPKTFFQEQMFTVCHHSCNENDILKVRNGEINNKAEWDVIEQSNVYYWLNRYFAFADENLNFRPEHFLKVMTDREIKDESKGKVMKNNAFFNPRDITLSFLPASKNLLFKLMGGKINRSGFDPSVVAHETSHYMFHHLFPNAINEEISGLNEGFADYIANAFLKNPKVGMVMMHGKALRDSSSPVDGKGQFKSYQPGMESHDMGERAAYALWTTRLAASDKNEMDRLVIDAVTELGRNPYSTIHDFKEKMIARLSPAIPDSKVAGVKAIWEISFPGSATKVASLAFLDQPIKAKSALGFRTKQILPAELAKDMGVPSSEESHFSIIQMANISESQIAILMAAETEEITTPYWVVIDAKRNNILAIYSLDKKLVTDEDEIVRIKPLADKAVGAVGFINDFTGKLKSFTDLAQGKGDFNAIYKVKDQSSSSETINFNGVPTQGLRIHLELKRRLLTGVLFGAPEVNAIELITIPFQGLSTPDLNGQKVIGYKLMLKTGTQMEVILDKFISK
jgi:hypothetical protein